eukprot:gene3450-6099_t
MDIQYFNNYNQTNIASKYKKPSVPLRFRRKFNMYLTSLKIPQNIILEFQKYPSEYGSHPFTPTDHYVQKIKESKNVTKLVLRKQNFPLVSEQNQNVLNPQSDSISFTKITFDEYLSKDETFSNQSFKGGSSKVLKSIFEFSEETANPKKKRKRDMEIENPIEDNFFQLNKKLRSL